MNNVIIKRVNGLIEKFLNKGNNQPLKYLVQVKKICVNFLNIHNFKKNTYRVEKRLSYLTSLFILTISSILFLNLSFGKTNGIENNLQPMPSVSVDMNGKSNVSYQIEVPEGTKGVDPELSIHYNSSGGFGNMGVGWNLSGIHWITRDATYGIDYTTNDKFTSTLGGALVRGNGADDNYYSRKETFIKFVLGSAYGSGQNAAPSTWTAYDKSGTSYVFRSRKAQGVLPSGDTIAVWALEDVRDIYQNGYTITYPTIAANAIRFNYADRIITINLKTVANPIASYSNSSAFPDNSIVDNIVITAGTNLSRTYSFIYNADSNGQEILARIDKSETINGGNINYTSISLTYKQTSPPSFTTISEFSNSDSYARIQIPLSDKNSCIQGEIDCLNFSMTTCSQELSATQTAAAAVTACAALPPTCPAAQANAVTATAAYTACINKKQDYNQKCNQYKNTWFIPCMTGMSSPMAVQTPIDINGDGKQEIALINGSTSAGTVHIEIMSLTNGAITKSSASSNFANVQYKTFQTSGFGDVNGDGKTDFVYSDGSKLQVAFSNGSTFSAPVGQANVSIPLSIDNYRTNTPDFAWKGGLIDINGDNRADYIKVIDGSKLGIHLSQGTTFGNETTVNVGTVFQDLGEGQEPGQFIDINGDRIPEYVFVQSNQIVAKYFNSSFTGILEPKTFPISEGTENARNRWLADINRDGKIDFITLNSSLGYTVYLFDGVRFNKQDAFYISNTTYSTKDNPMPKFFADVNGDGYTDIIRHCPDGVIRISFGNGLSFSDAQSDTHPGMISLPAKYLWSIADLNGDGLTDIISIKETQGSSIRNVSPALQAIGNAQNSWDNTIGSLGGNSSITNAVVTHFMPPSMNYWLDILSLLQTASMSYESKVEVFIQKPRVKENQIELVDGRFGRTISLAYTDCKIRNNTPSLDYDEFGSQVQYGCSIAVSSLSPSIPPTPPIPAVSIGSGAYPNLPNTGIGDVVASITTKVGSLYSNTDTYAYSDNRIWMGTPDQVAGLGFRERTITSSLSGDTHLERYIQASNIYAGLSDYNETTNSGVGYKQKTSMSYTPYASYPPGRDNWMALDHTSQTAYRDGVFLITTDQSYVYDLYGNVKTKTTSAAGSTVIEENTFLSDDGRWILARPNQTKKTIDNVTIENTLYSYSDDKNITVTSMAGTVAAATSYITLDNYGNQQSVKDPLNRITSYEYDSVVHNYVTKVTNPANFIVTKTYDTSLGLELTALDANGAVMTKKYDNKGRLSEIIPPGADSYVERYSYVDYAVGGAYFKSVTKAIVNPDGGETLAEEYFDMLGRSVRKESPGVGNNIIVETTEYDSKGQVTRKSNPYLENLETPVYTVYTYNPYEGYVTKVNHPDGGYTIPTYNGFNESTQTYASDATLIGSQDLIKNAKGQVLTRTIDGKSLNYQYDTAGRLTKILDPEGQATITAYDNAGRKISVTDVNSGTTSYTYDQVGNIKTQKDAKNITATFTYDNLNRPTSVSYSNGEGNTVLTYDEGGKNKFALGRLTTVVDDAGKLELGYDIKGNRTYQKRIIDDLEIIFKRDYDIQSRLASTTYPDGTKVYQKYATTGHFSGITMDTADGSSKGYTVGSYNGPVIENGQFKIIRETGNGVKMEIEYDPIKRRPKGLVTKLASGHIENAVSYTYDQKNNITQIADAIVSGRTQDFVYDAQNRLTKATGKYGTETYTYSDGGNLTQRGQFTLAYGDANHKHAVTAVTSPSTGTFNYSYDEAGNMISRNGDTMSYNSQGKLKQIDTEGGDKLVYLYDSTGNRIKKTSKTSGVVVYNFDGLYEIAKTPGEGDKHTLYFKGLHGDLFSQMTRNDAQLITSNSPFFLCSNISISCKDYYSNTIKFYLSNYAIKMYSIISKVEYDIAVWMLVVLSLYGFYFVYKKKEIGLTSEGIESKWFAKRTLSVTPLLTVAILFTFTNCGIFGGGKKKGDAPWLLLASGVNANTPSVDSPANGDGSVSGGGSGGGSGGSALVPVVGMYFLHPDHLGSITMITDGRGNVIAGGNNGGKSHISYTPYGSIHRTDSSGPDITRFKYTGQEEDKESGLLYYKARYYDPTVGRFQQPDTEIHADRIQGLNRYMYAEGNPTKFSDNSGHQLSTPIAYAFIEYLSAPQDQKNEAFAYGFYKGKQIEKQEKREKYHRKVYNALINIGATFITVGTVLLGVAAYTGSVNPWLIIPGLVLFFGGCALLSTANYHRSKYIDRDPDPTVYFSYSYSPEPEQSQSENKKNENKSNENHKGPYFAGNNTKKFATTSSYESNLRDVSSPVDCTMQGGGESQSRVTGNPIRYR